MIRSHASVALALGLLASAAAAQAPTAPTKAVPIPAPHAARSVGAPSLLPTLHYDLATGAQYFSGPTAVGGQGGVQRVLMSCYANDSFVGSYTAPAAGEEFVGWGDKTCSLTGFLGGFVLGYGTTALDTSLGGPGASLELALYQGTTGGGHAYLGTQVARFTFSALPGRTGSAAAGFLLPVSLATPLRLCDGDIGWGYAGTDGLSGPILVATTGTCFGTPDPVTGTEDCFDVYVAPAPTGAYLGTFAFGTPGISSFYLELEEYDGSSSTSSVFNGTGVNPMLFTEVSTPIPTHPWVTMIDTTGHPGALATIVALSNDTFGAIPTAFGELLIDVTPANYFFEDIVLGEMHTLVAPKAPSLLGEDIYTQGAIFDPTAGGLILLNGITFTMDL